MKIWLLPETIPESPQQGHLITQRNLAEIIAKTGNDVLLFSNKNIYIQTQNKGTLYFINNNFFFLLNSFLKSGLLLTSYLRNKYDCIIYRHTFYKSSLLDEILTFPLTFIVFYIQKKPILVYIAGSEWQDYHKYKMMQKRGGNIIVKIIEKINFLYLSKTKIILSSQKCANWLISDLKADSGKIYSLPKTIDEKIFNDKNILFEFKIPFQISQYILYIGRIDEGKGLNIFLEAINKLNNENIIIQVIIVGDGLLFNSVVEFIKKYSLFNVHLLKNIDHKYIPSLIEQSLFVIYPIEWGEGLGNVHIETMAMGKPIITFPINDVIIKTYKDSNIGILCSQINSEDLKKAIISLYTNKEKRELQSNNALMYYKENFSNIIIMKKWTRLLNHLKLI